MADRQVSYFGEDFFAFLNDLERNNNRDWYHANKDRYVASIQEPSLRFIRDVGPRIKAFSPRLAAEAKPFGGSLSRIYRDVRFSKDKSPYRTNVGIHFWYKASLGKETHVPGFYLQLAPGECFAASGVWHPEAPTLDRIRSAIVTRSDAWRQVVRETPPLEGESLFRPPKGYDPSHPLMPDLRRKDYIASVGFRDREVTAPGFLEDFLGACRTLNPLNRFLAEAMGLPW